MEKYIEQQPFSCGLSLVRNANYQYAYIDESGKVVIPFGLYSWCDPTFVCGFARVIVQRGADYKKWGIIDTLGNIVVPIKYDNIWGLRENHLDKIKAFINEKEISINLFTYKPRFLLDDLHFIASFSVDKFKSVFHVNRIDVKIDPNSKELYMQYGSNIGAVGCAFPPKAPKLSIVTNSLGDVFTLLHESEDEGKKRLEKIIYQDNIATQVPKRQGGRHHTSSDSDETDYINSNWYDPYGYIRDYNDGWGQEDVDSGLYDAYEGDYEAYYNR